MVLLRGAHPAAVRPLVETLLEGHAPGDPEAPCVRVCFSPHELLDAPVGARVVLVGAERAPEWLNIHRPVVWERELVLLLWVEDDALEHLRRNAPDFLDWVSHRIEVPWFAPQDAVAELQQALARVTWIAVAGAELVSVAAEGLREIEASWRYDEIMSAMERNDVLVRGLERDEELWRLLIAHAEVRWRHRVLLVEPRVLPPFVWVIDARIEDWEQNARRLELLGAAHARLVAALDMGRASRSPLARWLAINEPHMELLGCVARSQLDDTTVKLARALGFPDVADHLELTTWSNDEVTPERIERSWSGGFRGRSALGRYVGKVIADELQIEPRQAADFERMAIVVHRLFDDAARLLRAWDPRQEPSFERYLRRIARRAAAGDPDQPFETRNAAEAAFLSPPKPRKPSP